MHNRPRTVLSSLIVCGICWAPVGWAVAAEVDFCEAARLYQQGRWQSAADALAAYIASPAEAKQLGAAHFYLGESLTQLGHYVAAAEHYRFVLEQLGQGDYFPQALFRAGETAWLSGNSAESGNLLQKFIRDFPHDAWSAYAFTYLGDIAFRAKDYDRSINAYQTVVGNYGHSPQIAIARLGLAKALLAAGRTSEVTLALGRLAKGKDRSIADEALLLQARAQYELGQYDDALKSFRKLYQDLPDNELTRRARLAGGWSLWKLGRFEEIGDEIAQLVGSTHWMVDHRYLLGMCAYGDRDWSTAIERLSLAADGADKHPSRHAILYYLAESCFRAGQLDNARKWYRRLSSDQPLSPWSDDALWGLARVARAEADDEQFQAVIEELRKRFPGSDYLARIYREDAGGADLLDATEEEKLLDEAVGLERDGRYDAALAAYHELLQQQTIGRTPAEARRRAARLHNRLAQYSEASQLYREFLTENPHSVHAAEATFALAWIKVELGDREAAGKWFREVHAKFPQSAQAPDAAYWLALSAADESDSPLALELTDWMLDALAKSSDGRPRELWEQAVLLKCQLVASAGGWSAIEDLLEQSGSRLKRGNNQARAIFWLAEAKFRTGRFAEARDAFDQLRPEVESLDEPWTAMVPLRQAQLRLRRQQWTEVLKLVDQIEKKHPEFELQYEVDYLRGRALAGRGEMTSARAAYNRVLKNQAAKGSETVAMAQWMIGETFFHQRDYTRARKAYLQVIKSQSQPEWQSRAALQAGKCWELEEAWGEARNLYASALEQWQETQSAPQLKARLKWADSQTMQRR